MELACRVATFLVDPADPELAGNRAASARPLPNCRVNGRETSANGEILISGTADAVALNTDTTIDVVIDRKSNIELDAGKLNAYLDQLEAYRNATDASRALVLLMTSGKCSNSVTRRDAGPVTVPSELRIRECP